MKVGDLLSGPTLTSSRTLTVFAATILIVVWTDTNPKDLPLLKGLNLDQTNVYWLLSGLLFFLSVVHVVNWWNDNTSERKANLSDAHAVILRKKTPITSATAWLDAQATSEGRTRRELFAFGEAGELDRPQILNAIKTEAAEKRSRQLNFAIQFGLHISVPMSLAVGAAIGLIFRLW
ncbi:MAG: hypothetical protein ABJM26_04855 [Anderseniella sp.]